MVSGVGRRSPSRQLAVNNATLSGLAMGHGRQFGGDLRQLFHSPISRQQCYPFWACNGTWPTVRRRPPAVVPLSKEWTGQVTRSRLITLICVQGTMLLFDDRQSATGFTGGAGVSSREESSAWHAQLSFSPAATRLVSDGRPGALAHGVVALHGAAQRARFGLCGPARSNCWRNTGVSCALESVGNQRSS